jgi:diguanylate cyclase (GGDEF)-like protein
MHEAPNSSNVDTDPDVGLLVREDKLRLLFQQSFPALFISYAIAVLLGWMLWGHASNIAIVAWLGVLTVATLARLALFLSYFRIRPRGADVLRLERPYAVSLMASSLVWGIGALIVMPADSLLYQALTLCVVVGMAGGAISMYSARYPMAIGAMAAVLLPSTLWLFTQGGRAQLGLAIGASLFMVVLVRAAKVLAGTLQDNFRLGRELHAAHAASELQAKTDPLTGLANRRAFLNQGEQIVRYCERHELPLCVLVMDIDNFKAINDTIGHHAGDTVLRRVGEIIGKLFRRSDVCGRLGGEEFAVVLPHTFGDDALATAEKLRQTIAESEIPCGDRYLNVTLSVGIADAGYDMSTLLVHADKAMYRAKEQGRNQVVRYEESFAASGG